jgi:hypothetical protein
MDWITWALLAVLALGAAAGIALAVRSWLTNPATLTNAAVFLFNLLMPRILLYLFKRMDPETEARMRACIRSGGKWNNVKKRCE